MVSTDPKEALTASSSSSSMDASNTHQQIHQEHQSHSTSSTTVTVSSLSSSTTLSSVLDSGKETRTDHAQLPQQHQPTLTYSEVLKHKTQDSSASISRTLSSSSTSSSSSIASQSATHSKHTFVSTESIKKHSTSTSKASQVKNVAAFASKRFSLSPEWSECLQICIRSYGVGYVFATLPKVVKTVIGFITSPKKAAKGQNPLVAIIKALLTTFKEGFGKKKDGLSMMLLITLGGYKVLELVMIRGLKQSILQQQWEQEMKLKQGAATVGSKTSGAILGGKGGSVTAVSQQSQEHGQEQTNEGRFTEKARRRPTWNDHEALSKISLDPDLGQRITILSSLMSSLAAMMFMQRRRPNFATIDYLLFAVVRALDVFGHVAVAKKWGGQRFLGQSGAVAVFVIACTEIMFSWVYEPHRLPGPYAFWITKMSEMDPRFLLTLREIRANNLEFGVPCRPHLRTLLMDFCVENGLPPAMGDFESRSRMPCELVHHGIHTNCEVHAGYRWMRGFLVSTGIYLPVHLLPALLSPKLFLQKLTAHPIQTLGSTLMATARSSAFLATFVVAIWYGICTWRSKVMPLTSTLLGRKLPGSVVDNIYGPLFGCFLCGFSVLIEKPHRRAEMALYVLPRATFSMWSRWMGGKLSFKSEQRGARLLYAISMSVLLTGIRWRKDLIRPSMQGLLGWILAIKRTQKKDKVLLVANEDEQQVEGEEEEKEEEEEVKKREQARISVEYEKI